MRDQINFTKLWQTKQLSIDNIFVHPYLYFLVANEAEEVESCHIDAVFAIYVQHLTSRPAKNQHS